MLDAPSESLVSKLGAAAQRDGGGRANRKGPAGGSRRPGASARASRPGKPQQFSRSAAAGFRSAAVLPDSDADDLHDFVPARRPAGGLRIRVNGGLPRSLTGRLAVGGLVLVLLAGFTGSVWAARSVLLRDPRLVVPSFDHVTVNVSAPGTGHVTRAQLLSVFGEDVGRNLLTVPLGDRRAQLESLPWVEHATVMRLLPDRLNASLVERTPVAFTREGGRIGLVDAHGVLLDLTPGSAADSHYSFPVVTGILAGDPLSVRAARMKLFTQFVGSLDEGAPGAAGKASSSLSEVDLSNPEDVKALVPGGGSDILVHFGEGDFLARYRRYQRHLPEWKTQFPKLASVDMRYERDVVLEMQPGTGVAVNEGTPAAEPELAGKQARGGAGKGKASALAHAAHASASAKPAKIARPKTVPAAKSASGGRRP